MKSLSNLDTSLVFLCINCLFFSYMWLASRSCRVRQFDGDENFFCFLCIVRFSPLHRRGASVVCNTLPFLLQKQYCGYHFFIIGVVPSLDYGLLGPSFFFWISEYRFSY